MKLRDEYWLLVRDLETGKVARMVPVAPPMLEAYAEAVEPRQVDCRD